MDNIVVIGSSGHAKVIIDIVEQEGRYRITGLLDRYRGLAEEGSARPRRWVRCRTGGAGKLRGRRSEYLKVAVRRYRWITMSERSVL